MLTCLLCLNVTFLKNAFNLNERQECDETIEELVKIHFWFSNVNGFLKVKFNFLMFSFLFIENN